MGIFARWQFTPSFTLSKTKGDRLWWVDTVRGHREYTFIGVKLTDVRIDGHFLGQELHAVVGPLRIGIAMRFTHAALHGDHSHG